MLPSCQIRIDVLITSLLNSQVLLISSSFRRYNRVNLLHLTHKAHSPQQRRWQSPHHTSPSQEWPTFETLAALPSPRIRESRFGATSSFVQPGLTFRQPEGRKSYRCSPLPTHMISVQHRSFLLQNPTTSPS